MHSQSSAINCILEQLYIATAFDLINSLVLYSAILLYLAFPLYLTGGLLVIFSLYSTLLLYSSVHLCSSLLFTLPFFGDMVALFLFVEIKI